MGELDVFKDLQGEIKEVLFKSIKETLCDDEFWPVWIGEIKWNLFLGGKIHQSEELEKLGCKFQKKRDDPNCVVWKCPKDIVVYSIGEYGSMNYYRLKLADGGNYIVSVNNETLHDPRVEIISLKKIPNRIKREICVDLLKSLPMNIVFKFSDDANKMIAEFNKNEQVEEV